MVLRLKVYSSIRDHLGHTVGLRITGTHPNGETGQVDLTGTEANTFTGDVIVEGLRNTIHLNKLDGVTSIRSKNIYIRNQAAMNIVGSEQIANSATVTISDRSTLSFSSVVKEVRETVHALVVKKGTNRLAFWHPQEFKDSSKKTLILDDLEISADALLRISGWEEGRDHLLVRKTSKHLKDSLKRIRVDGWAKNQIYLRDYDSEYWSIEAAPEPATYGAILGAVGWGLWKWRRKRELRKP